MITGVMFRLAYLMLGRILDWLVLLARSDTSKYLEILHDPAPRTGADRHDDAFADELDRRR